MLAIPLSKPDISPLEHQYVQDVLLSNRLATGPFLARFEAQMARLCRVRHAIAVSSGTAALHLGISGLGLGPGDEVITTPFSFIASSNVILFVGATPRFVDIDPTTYLLDLDRSRQAISPATRGILAVDVFGLPMDWPTLAEMAQAHGLFLMDDACHALGASVNDRPIGSWGNFGAFGFYPNKQITTGEGGCITTDSDALAAYCRSLRNQGRTTDHMMEHDLLGYNYRMNELSAALGCAQLERLPELLQSRQQVAQWYLEALSPLQDDLVLPTGNGRRSWFVFVVQLGHHYAPEARDMLIARLHQREIASAPYFPSIHLQPYYRQRFGFKPGDFPICEAVSARTLALPFFNSLTQAEVHRVVEEIREVLPTLPRNAPSVRVQ